MVTGASERLSWLDETSSFEATCPACGNADGNRTFLRVSVEGHVVRNAAAVDVARCGRCASAWFPGLDVEDSYPAADPSRLTDQFWTWIDHYVELVGGLGWKVMLVERLPRAGVGVGRVLEVGCNTGVLLDYITRMWGVEVVGLEPSAYGLAGRERFGLDIRPAYMAELIAGGCEPFDVVVTTEVIEHVDDPAQFLRELRALVRVGGLVLLTTPNAEGLTPARTPGQLYAMLSVGSHRTILSAGRLTDLARDAGFGSVDVAAESTTLLAVLADEPVSLGSLDDPRASVLAYHDDRLAHPGPTEPTGRWELADRIARYVVARELAAPDALDGEQQIDELLRVEFDVDVLELSSVVGRAAAATTIIEFGQIAPFSLPAYLYHRGHRDDISEQVRTEMWETAVVLIGRGMAIDPVNLFLLEVTLDDTLVALRGRSSQRWNEAARSALADSAELAARELPVTPERNLGLRGHAARIARGGLRRLARLLPGR